MMKLYHHSNQYSQLTKANTDKLNILYTTEPIDSHEILRKLCVRKRERARKKNIEKLMKNVHFQ